MQQFFCFLEGIQEDFANILPENRRYNRKPQYISPYLCPYYQKWKEMFT